MYKFDGQPRTIEQHSFFPLLFSTSNFQNKETEKGFLPPQNWTIHSHSNSYACPLHQGLKVGGSLFWFPSNFVR